MPDTPENQEAYPQVYNQKRGVGFPIARVGALTSLACGAILNLGVCRYAGKGQGEVSLLRQLWDVLRPGDVLLTDRGWFHLEAVENLLDEHESGRADHGHRLWCLLMLELWVREHVEAPSLVAA